MRFNSYIFILFLPLCVIGYFILNKHRHYKSASLFLLVMSFVFYGYFNFRLLFLLFSSIIANYIFYLLLKKGYGQRIRKTVAFIAILANLGALAYFKYWNFFMDNINSLFHLSLPIKEILLPLGISFFTFQQLSFVIDAYRQDIKTDYDLLNYALYVSFFPQFIAGPIVTHDELIPQLQSIDKRTFSFENAFKGSLYFVIGLAKKVLIADILGVVVDSGYAAVNSMNTLSAAIVLVSYIMQLYFDFSGYSDMAIGMAKIFNLDLPVNFRSPFSIKCPTIVAFWDNYHITLTRFFTKYLYIPLGGNRRGTVRMLFNTMTVFLISGLWHGSDWSFVLWGMLHGIFLCITKLCKNSFEKLPRIVNWLITFAFLNLSFAYFRADSIQDANILLGCLMKGFGPINLSMSMQFKIIFVLAFALMFIGYNARDVVSKVKPCLIWSIAAGVLLIICILSFQKTSSFLYFNF